jgi:hypothetical protein
MQFFTPGISLYGSMPIHSSPACSPIAATLRQTRESCVSSKRVVYGEISVKKQTNKIVYELQDEVHLKSKLPPKPMPANIAAPYATIRRQCVGPALFAAAAGAGAAGTAAAAAAAAPTVDGPGAFASARLMGVGRRPPKPGALTRDAPEHFNTCVRD